MKVAYVLGRFPVVSETFVAGEIREMERLGHEVRVFALGEGDEAGRALLGGIHAHVAVMAREGPWRALARIAAYALSQPARLVRGVLASARSGGPREVERFVRATSWAWDAWLAEADRIHAHFASEPARVAHRLHLATGVPFGVTGHATDLFPLAPDVAKRLRAAGWVVTVCEYNRRALLEAEPWLGEGGRLHLVPCGVDARQFDRRPAERTARNHGGAGVAAPPRVVAVGRLVAKKGFADLVDAAASLHARGVSLEVRICGDGPMRAALAERIARFEVGGVVRLLGALDHDAVRDEIERAALLALPAVIAADGDRDSMPLVLKEAMSLGVPVVGTRVAGLPEAIDESCGRLVDPHDPRGLADAIGELLAMTPRERAALGARGRERVLADFDLAVLTSRFADVLAAADANPP